MPLPILHHRPELRSEDLVRQFHQTQRHWSQHLAEESALDVGTAFLNPGLREVDDANNMSDVALPDGLSVAAALQQVEEHFSAHQSACRSWTMNPSANADATRPIVEGLQERGFKSVTVDILLLQRHPDAVRAAEDLKIVPARASFRHTQEMFEAENSRMHQPAALAAAAMLHLDDPHWDALIALRDSAAIAHVGVLAMGEVGRIDSLLVRFEARRQGIGRIMMGRALEICARSLFKHVMLCVDPQNISCATLFQKLGFAKIGQSTRYVAPEVS